MLADDTCAYDYLFLLLLFLADFISLFWWYFNFAKSFSEDLKETGSVGKREISTGLETWLFLSNFLLGMFEILLLLN